MSCGGRSREPLDPVLRAEQPGQPSGGAARDQRRCEAAENPMRELGLRGRSPTPSGVVTQSMRNEKAKKRIRLRLPSAENDRGDPGAGFPAQLTRPSATQSEEEKKLALQAAASLTNPDLSDGTGAGTDRDHDSDAHLSDSDSRASVPEDLPRMMPQTLDDLI
ncbi:hypothetical protein NDU88_003748 [Pleurodeles waltl]|uniref:Uncharacterized protein n=1 Tax=Pleurodeles waltl TaxID=8319 RepID=A0AAV7T6G8_PLEWA|nr:hypothetical protein NDU88_003748 [Pleurodeles waltl]